MTVIRYCILFSLLFIASTVAAQNQDVIPDGEYKTYYTDGTTIESISNYKDGQLNGKIIQYHENGKVFVESFFVDGKRNGTTKLYYKNGQLMEESIYKDGVYNGQYKRYYSNGNLRAERKLKENKLNGSFKEYYPNGLVSEEGKGRNGRYHGNIRRYNREGQLVYKAKYADGVNDGPFSSYYADGKIEESCAYTKTDAKKARRDCTRYKRDGQTQGNYFQILTRKDNNSSLVRTYVGELMVREEVVANQAL